LPSHGCGRRFFCLRIQTQGVQDPPRALNSALPKKERMLARRDRLHFRRFSQSKQETNTTMKTSTKLLSIMTAATVALYGLAFAQQHGGGGASRPGASQPSTTGGEGGMVSNIGGGGTTHNPSGEPHPPINGTTTSNNSSGTKSNTTSGTNDSSANKNTTRMNNNQQNQARPSPSTNPGGPNGR
jgi:hypothetical protein